MRKLLIGLIMIVTSFMFTGCLNFGTDVVGKWEAKHLLNPEKSRYVEFFEDNTLVASKGTNIRNRFNGTWTMLDNDRVKITLQAGIQDKVFTVDIKDGIGFRLGEFLYFRDSVTSERKIEYMDKYPKN